MKPNAGWGSFEHFVLSSERGLSFILFACLYMFCVVQKTGRRPCHLSNA